MSASGLGEITEAGLRCPVCRAQQEWSDVCRRCKCDLSLLRSVAEAYSRGRRRCLSLLRAGRFSEGLDEARRAQKLHPGAEAARLVAVCAMLCGQWEEAVAAVRSPAERPAGSLSRESNPEPVVRPPHGQ
jgi:hypothetical protein